MKLILFAILVVIVIWSLRAFVRAETKKLANKIRSLIIFLPILIAVILIFLGKFLFSLPFFVLILPLLKAKGGLTLFQLFRLWSLLQILKSQGRFSFGQTQATRSTMSIAEAYKILNLDPKKKYTKEQVQKQYKRIISKVHPDISPDCARLASIVNTARDTVLENL